MVTTLLLSTWVLQGGGFCGARQKLRTALDLSSFDGVALRVKGDGSIFKLNIKTTDQLDMPESTYQVRGMDWVCVAYISAASPHLDCCCHGTKVTLYQLPSSTAWCSDPHSVKHTQFW